MFILFIRRLIFIKPLLLCVCMALLFPSSVFAWTEHSLITQPILQTMPEITNKAPVKVETLADFVSAEAQDIALLLEQHSAKFCFLLLIIISDLCVILRDCGSRTAGEVLFCYSPKKYPKKAVATLAPL